MDNFSQRIRCLVVDDEPLAREVIARFIARVPTLELVADCDNAIRAMTIIRQQPVDLLFVDILMPELLGTELIRILGNTPKVILTTAFPEYAVESYELDVVDYLLKPIQFERFLKAVNKASIQIGIAAGPAMPAPSPPAGPTLPLAERPQGRTEPYLYFRTDRKMVKVMLDDIVYIEGMKNYIKIISSKGVIITKNSMAAIEAMLPESAFLRIHRSYIVSKSKIRSFTGELIAVGNAEIPIGKLYKQNVMKLLGE
jgi:two-component system, LytTR family, response regulator